MAVHCFSKFGFSKQLANAFAGAALFFALLASLIIVAPPAKAATGRVAEIYATRLASNAEKTRFSAKISFAIGYNVYVMANPYRVIIDMGEVVFNLPPSSGTTGDGLVKGFRFGQLGGKRSRIVIDVTGPVLIEKSVSVRGNGDKPARLIVDLIPTDLETFASIKAADEATNFVARENARSKKDSEDGLIPQEIPPISANGKKYDPIGEKIAANKPKRVIRDTKINNNKILIVIDPGHGGIDAGALSKKGIKEKNIVLDFSKRLKRQLQAYGHYRVILTRKNDKFLRLAARRDVAHKNQADLFIAVHADTFKYSSVRGTTLYTLSDKASDEEAAALAEKENRADIIGGVNLAGENKEITNILIDLAQRETKNHSIFFAKKAITNLRKVTRLTKRPLKSAGFVVLKAPDVPSVLLELGYLSNKKDISLLVSKKWQNKVARAMARAIDGYFRAKLALN